ncbi:MAG: hypothetical protein IT221_15615 [Fluviicola sp.]|nr:hypothetical protein [Fluviicola sp.]
MKSENHLAKQLQIGAWISLLACVSYYITIIFLGEEPFDVGDGLEHFAISKQSWKEPIFFIDHWGKSFFVLFSSVFAQFGFKVYTLFNVLVFAITIGFIFDCLKHFRIHGIVSIVAPLIFVSIPDYTHGVIAGLTEPFFGCLLTIMLWASIKEKWWLFAIIASFTPFARSEGALVVFGAPFVLIAFKQWKSLPLLTFGFVVYAILGMLINDQPLWYFENDPYPEYSPYGHGNWTDYLFTYKQHLGVVMVFLSPLIFFGWFVWKQHQPRKTTILTFFFIGIYLGIIAIHSYYWANGLRGSMGLTRIATQGLPVAIAIGLICIGFVMKELHFLAKSFFAIIISLFSIEEVTELFLPIKSTEYNKMIHKSCNYVNQHKKEIGTIYYFHPMIAYFNNITTKENYKQYCHSFTQLEDDTKNRFKPGDIIIRDSKFGAIEQGMPFDKLKEYPWIIPVKHFYVNGGTKELNGEQQSIIIYQVFDKNHLVKSKFIENERSIALKKNIPNQIHEQKEFFNIDEHFFIPNFNASNQSLLVEYQLTSNEPIYFVIDDGKGEYISNQLDSQKSKIDVILNSKNKRVKIYLYNPSKQKYSFEFKSLRWKTQQDLGFNP